MKVYCYNCRYFRNNTVYLTSKCNKVIGMEDSPTMKIPIYANFRVDNKNNNCKYYKPNLLERFFSMKIFKKFNLKKNNVYE